MTSSASYLHSVLKRYEDALRRIAHGEYYAYRIAADALNPPTEDSEEPMTDAEAIEAAKEWTT